MSIETELDNVDKLLGSKNRSSQDGFLEIARNLSHIARKQNLELLKLQATIREDALSNQRSMEALASAARPVDADTIEDVARDVTGNYFEEGSQVATELGEASSGGSTHLTAPSNFSDQEDPTAE